MVRMKGVSMALPREGNAAKGTGSSNTGNAGPSRLVVTVTPKGEYFVGRQKVGRDNFKGALTSAVTRHPDTVVILNVAKSQNAQSLIDVVDSVNEIQSPSGQPLQILIATEPVDANGNALKPGR
jgi:biopolymer transport protein ExbD